MWEIIIGVIFIFFGIYKWFTWDYDYWKKTGVPFIKPSFLFGNMKDLAFMTKHTGEVYSEFYWKYPDEPAVGIFKFLTPQLVLRDVELIKTVLVKEFNSFHDNIFETDQSVDTISALNPFLAKGEKWKALRTFHSQTQSSGKIKGMFPLMLDVCQDMSQYINENYGKPIDAKYFSGQYTTDVVASCVYGLKTNSFVDPKAEFRRISAKIFEQSLFFNLLLIVSHISPKLTKLFRLRFISKEVTNFFTKVIKDLCEYRKANNVSRTDFLQTMLDENLKSDIPKYSFEEIAAHTMTFFLDGYETSSTVMAFVIYLLGIFPDHQQKIRDEIKEIEQISYEGVHSLKYLDAVINETLRLYPPGFTLTRLCTKDITLKAKDRNYQINKGLSIGIPIFSLHRDPDNFPEPEQFIPDRFYNNQPSPAFLPFGLGPRACLGSRFALTQIKTAIAYLVQNFKILPRDSDAKLPELENTSVFLLPAKPGLWIKFEPLSDE